MRLIDADALEPDADYDDGDYWAVSVAQIKNAPSVQPEIIRCNDCQYYEIAHIKKDGTDDKRYKPSICVKGKYGIARKPDWFCADAERRTNG